MGTSLRLDDFAVVPCDLIYTRSQPEVDETLGLLEEKGLTVYRRKGRFIDELRRCQHIYARAQRLIGCQNSAMVWAALDAGFEEILWVDADTNFQVSRDCGVPAAL